MSSSGGNTSEAYSFAAPGGNMSQSSPGSGMTGISSNDATVITMQRATGSLSRARDMRRSLRTFSRSTSPRITHNRSPKKSIEKVRITSGSPDHREASREVQLLEELRSSNMAYQKHSHLQSGYTDLYQRSNEEFANVSNYGRAIETRLLQEMVQEDEGARIRIEELEHKLRLAGKHLWQIQRTIRRICRASCAEQVDRSTADQLQTRMLALQDENLNMWEVAEQACFCLLPH